MMRIVTSPHVYKTLQKEINEGIQEGKISSPITDAEARKLPFLQACIKEGLRMWPPITGILPRSSAQDATICGVHVPAGTSIAWSPWSILRDRGVFGDDADLYWPQRWFCTNPTKSQAMDNTVELVFGQGRWGCLGRSIALVELNKIFVEVCWNFKNFDEVTDDSSFFVDLTSQFSTHCVR